MHMILAQFIQILTQASPDAVRDMIEPSVLENRNYSIPEGSAEPHTAGGLE